MKLDTYELSLFKWKVRWSIYCRLISGATLLSYVVTVFRYYLGRNDYVTYNLKQSRKVDVCTASIKFSIKFRMFYKNNLTMLCSFKISLFLNFQTNINHPITPHNYHWEMNLNKYLQVLRGCTFYAKKDEEMCILDFVL